MRTLIIMPLTLVAVAIIYVVANPSAQTVGQGPATPTATATVEPTATLTEASLPTEASKRAVVPEWRRAGHGAVTVGG